MQELCDNDCQTRCKQIETPQAYTLLKYNNRCKGNDLLRPTKAYPMKIDTKAIY